MSRTLYLKPLFIAVLLVNLPVGRAWGSGSSSGKPPAGSCNSAFAQLDRDMVETAAMNRPTENSSTQRRDVPNGDRLERVMKRAEQMLDKAEAMGIYGGSQRRQKAALAHMKADLSSLMKPGANGVSAIEKHDTKTYLSSALEYWDEFGEFWLGRLDEFEGLSEDKKQKYREPLELVFSLGVKHLISYLQAKSDLNIKVGRLREVLSSFKGHESASLETHLYLVKRSVLQYYSVWDFLNCKE